MKASNILLKFAPLKSAFAQLLPPSVVALVLYVQLVALCSNYNVYNTRELAIYCCWIPVLLLPYIITKKRIFYFAALTLIFLEGLINLCHIILLKGPVTASSLFVMLNTNHQEANDFFDQKLSLSFFLVLPYLLLFIYGLRKKNNSNWKHQSTKILALSIFLCITIFFAENIVNGRFERKAIPQSAKAFSAFYTEAASYAALKKRKVKQVRISKSDSSQRKVFVLIIGESCNRNHMSLYGYTRSTTPLLAARKDIFVFNNVISSYSNTLNSVLCMLTESNLENKKPIDKSMSLIDIFCSSSYKTYWLSNQSPVGVWDNSIYNLAATSSACQFINRNITHSHDIIETAIFDHTLCAPFQFFLKNKEEKKFIVVHLMGNHSKYSKRYPSAFAKFKTGKNEKEQIIDDYDNSILYNDYVVDSLLKILAKKSEADTSTLYSAIYLSDHGENVFDYGNAVGHDFAHYLPACNVEIPFIIWLSPQAQKADSNLINQMRANIAKPFVSDDLFHAVQYMQGIYSINYDSTRNFFGKSHNFLRKRIHENGQDYDAKNVASK